MRDKIADKQRLQHILKAILELEDFVKEINFEEFNKNRMMQQACVSNLMIIGEAASHLTADIKDKYNTVDWLKIKGLRNVIVHEYYKVDTNLIWQLIHNNLPDIKQIVVQAFKDLEEANQQF